VTMKLLFVLAAFSICALCQIPLEPCAFCSAVVGQLTTQVANEAEKWAEKLPSITSSVCSPFSAETLSYEKCTSFVSLFAPYAVDLLLSEMNPEEICGSLGVCEKPDSIHYELLFPKIEGNKVTYSATEKRLDDTIPFRYRIFLGKFPFLDNSTYSLSLGALSIADTEISIKLTNKKDYVETKSCGGRGECQIVVPKPGMGVWYYVTVNTKSSGEDSSFSLELKEENVIADPWTNSGGFQSGTFALQMVVVLLAIGVICLVITKCVFRRSLSHRLKQKENLEAAPMMEYPGLQFVFVAQDGLYGVPQYIPTAPTVQ